VAGGRLLCRRGRRWSRALAGVITGSRLVRVACAVRPSCLKEQLLIRRRDRFSYERTHPRHRQDRSATFRSGQHVRPRCTGYLGHPFKNMPFEKGIILPFCLQTKGEEEKIGSRQHILMLEQLFLILKSTLITAQKVLEKTSLSRSPDAKNEVVLPCIGYLAHLFGKTTVRAIKQAFTGCNLMCNQSKICLLHSQSSPCQGKIEVE
jgi:hypothetical protein